MRTLVVVRSLKMGGMERVAVNLADAFAEAGHESHLLSFREVADPLRPARDEVRVHRLNLRWWSRLTGVGLLLELFARLVINPLMKRSLFLGTGVMGGWVFRCWLGWAERRYGRFDRIVFRGVGTFELVWTFRDDRARYVLENILHVEKIGWRGHLMSRCLFDRRHLVTVSHGVAESLDEAAKSWGFTPASVTVIPNPCPIDGIRQAMAEPEPDLPDAPYLVNVARLVPAKDHALLLRAYAAAGTSMPLVLVGDGQERERLEALAEALGIAERVIFAGQRANPYPWMHHARLFVLSSRFEGMGIVLFEALACDTPVLSVDCPGGIREILKGDLEACITPHSVEGLAEGIGQALDRDKPAIQEAWLEDFRPSTVAAAFIASGKTASPS
ncbi:glycosyltransferase [Halomonas sp. SL1]|uniref:glycosyltransferase n=1 Tax=Halomonas sp. SL1 TaxID=2137478 RepID=UPI000D15576B|nr:glycosyltransferase [Halomonas sp. SL1]RAH38239.1 glycosyltransferase [Halomonas sp. SL1]